MPDESKEKNGSLHHCENMNHFIHALIHSFHRSLSLSLSLSVRRWRWWMCIFRRIQCRERTYNEKQWNSTKNVFLRFTLWTTRSSGKKWNMAAAAKACTALIVKTLMWWHGILHCPRSRMLRALSRAPVAHSLAAVSREGYYAVRGSACFHIFLYIIMGASDIYHNIITPQINAYTFRWWKGGAQSNLYSLKFFFFSLFYSNYFDRVSSNNYRFAFHDGFFRVFSSLFIQNRFRWRIIYFFLCQCNVQNGERLKGSEKNECDKRHRSLYTIYLLWNCKRRRRKTLHSPDTRIHRRAESFRIKGV